MELCRISAVNVPHGVTGSQGIWMFLKPFSRNSGEFSSTI